MATTEDLRYQLETERVRAMVLIRRRDELTFENRALRMENVARQRHEFYLANRVVELETKLAGRV